MTKHNNLTNGARAERALDYVGVPIRLLEDFSDISDKELGAAVRLASYFYKRPDSGNRITNAKEWKVSKWMSNCSGLNPKAIKNNAVGLWHWEENDFVLDCFLELRDVAMVRRKVNRENAQGGKAEGENNTPKNERLLSDCSAIAQRPLSDCLTSISKSTSISTSIGKAYSQEQSNKGHDESSSLYRDSQSFNDEPTNKGIDKIISQVGSVEETKTEFIVISGENEAGSFSQPVESLEQKREQPSQAITAPASSTTPAERIKKALEVSETKQFQTWMKDRYPNVKLEPLRGSLDGQRRILDCVTEYELESAQAVAEDDIPF